MIRRQEVARKRAVSMQVEVSGAPLRQPCDDLPCVRLELDDQSTAAACISPL